MIPGSATGSGRRGQASGLRAVRRSRLPGVVGLLSAVGWILPVGCIMPPLYPPAYPMVSQPLAVRTAPDMTQTVYAAADQLRGQLQDKLDLFQSIVPATFVDMDNLETTSPLGRLMARQVASRLTQHGYILTELKLRKDVAMRKGQGEFLLSRDLDEIRQKNTKAQAALVGSYLMANNTLFVTAQVVRIRDQAVLASQEFQLPVTSDLRAMLRGQT